MKLKYFVAVMIIIGATVSVAFADNTTISGIDASATAGLLQTVVKAASLLRIVPAIIAGKLMTNSFVMGEVIGIDDYLYRFWTIMMIVANIGVAGVLLKMVIDGINEGKLAEKLKSSIGTIVIGVVGIQLSWFGVTSMIDIANIAVAGIGQQMNGYVKENFKTTIQKVLGPGNFNECYRQTKSEGSNFSEGGSRKDCLLDNYKGTREDRVNNFIDNVILDGNSLSGPLMFLGLGIYKYTDYGYISNPKMTVNGVSMYMLVQLAMLFFTFVPMWALMLINFLRIGYIWLWLAFGPIIVLGWMYKELSGGKVDLFGDKGKIFDIGNIIALIFQPVISVIGVSLTVIFTMSMYEGMQPKDGDLTGVSTILDQIHYKSSGAGVDQQSYIGTDNGGLTLNGAISEGTSLVGGGLGYLLITMFSIFIMRTTIRFTSEFAEITNAAVKKSIDNMRKVATKSIKVGEKGKEVDLDAAMKMMNINKPLDAIKARMSNRVDSQTKTFREETYKSGVGKLFGLNTIGDLDESLAGGFLGGGKTETTAGKKSEMKGLKEVADIETAIKFITDREAEGIQNSVPMLIPEGKNPGTELMKIFQLAAKEVKAHGDWEEFKFDKGGQRKILQKWYDDGGGKQYLAIVHNKKDVMDMSFDEAMGPKGADTVGWALGQVAPGKYPAKKLIKNSSNSKQVGNEIDFIKLLKKNEPESRDPAPAKPAK